MPSDAILDSLCSAGLASKKDICIPSHEPEYHYRALGTSSDTTFYNNSATLYRINLYIAKKDNTTVILNNAGGGSKYISKTNIEILIEKLAEWFNNIKSFGGSCGYTQNGGIAFMGRGSAQNANIPYRAKHAEIMPDADYLFALMGSFASGPGNNLDFATGLSYLTEALKTMKPEPEPAVPGFGVLKPKVYKSKKENISEDESDNDKGDEYFYQRLWMFITT